jgi:hypothetical protein
VATLGYYDNYLVDNHSCVIVEVQATAARRSQESAAARDMVTRFTERRGGSPQTLAADATYGNGELLHWLQERGIAPHLRARPAPSRWCAGSWGSDGPSPHQSRLGGASPTAPGTCRRRPKLLTSTWSC